MKKIVIAHYLLEATAKMPKVFYDSDYQIIKEIDINENSRPDYCVVESVEKLMKVKEYFTNLNHVVKFVYVGKIDDVQDFYRQNGTALIDPYWLANDIGKLLIKRVTEEQPSIHLQEVFRAVFEKYFSYKISSLYRLGYYGDLMAKDAIDQNINFVATRSFFDHIMLYISYLKELDMATLPCELEYAINDDCFAIMVHVSCANINPQYLSEALAEDNIRNPMNSLLRICLRNSDLFDVMYYPKIKRLCFIGVWANQDQSQSIVGPSLSINIHDAQRLSMSDEDVSDYKYDFTHQSDPLSLKSLDDQGIIPKLPGDHQPLVDLSDKSTFSNNPDLMQELSSFIKQKINEEMKDKKLSEISADDVTNILKDYPDQQVVTSLTPDDAGVLSIMVRKGQSPLQVEDEGYTQSVKKLPKILDEESLAELEDLSKTFENLEQLPSEEVSEEGYIPNWEEDITIVKSTDGGIQAASSNDDKLDFASKLTESLSEDAMQPGFQLQALIDDPSTLFSSPLMKVAEGEMKVSPQLKKVIAAKWQDGIKKSLGTKKISEYSEDEIQTMMLQQIEGAVSQALLATDPEIAMIAGVAYQAPEESFKAPVNKLKTQLSGLANKRPPEEKMVSIIGSLQKAAADADIVVQGHKQPEEMVLELIKRLPISKKQKEFLNKKVQEAEEEVGQEVDESLKAWAEDEELVTIVKGSQKKKERKTVIVQSKGVAIEEDDDAIILRGEAATFKAKPISVRNSTSQGDDGDDDQPLVIKGKKGIKEKEGYTVVPGSGKSQVNDGYTVRISGEKSTLTPGEFRVSDQSKLVEKIKDLEDQLSKVEMTKVEGLSVEEHGKISDDVKNNASLNELQKDQIFELLRKDKEMTAKYQELQDAYNKSRAIIHAKDGHHEKQLGDLQLEMKQKELLVDQIKYKMENMQREYEKNLKQQAFEQKKLSQKGAVGNADSLQRKITTLERERDNMKHLVDEYKRQALLAKDNAAKAGDSSSKTAEIEARQKSLEVKFLAKDKELQMSNAKVAEKDKMLSELQSVKNKLEFEISELKKDVLQGNAELAAEKAAVPQAVTPEKNVYESKMAALKEEVMKERSTYSKALTKERENMEEMKRAYLVETNKVKSLEMKLKEITTKLTVSEAKEVATQTSVAAASAAAAEVSAKEVAKDTSGLATKHRLLEESHKKVMKDFNESKVKFEEMKKELMLVTKKSSETQFKLLEKEKLLEKLQAELKALKEPAPKKAS